MIIWIIIAAVLAVINMIQYRSRRTMMNQLNYIARKINTIVTNNTSEKLLLMTDKGEVRSLLEGINQLLERQQKTSANYMNTESSVRRMLSNISHDLRTPLTVVLGYIETLSLRPDLDAEERTQLLGKVQRKSQEVLELIEAFFDLAKLEAGDKEVPLTRVMMNPVCQRNILSFYEVLTTNGFEVEINIPEMPVYAYANEEALDRILNNLISNAIRYGRDGKLVGLTLREDASYVYVDIMDRGKGIQEAHFDRIFERMYTLEDSRNKQFQGSGLGLTITKRLVEKQQGQISLSSKPYKNTTFTVQLKKVIEPA